MSIPFVILMGWMSTIPSQHCFGKWICIIRQQAITLANVEPDIYRHMASLNHSELIDFTHPLDIKVLDNPSVGIDHRFSVCNIILY